MRIVTQRCVGLLVDVQERLYPHMHQKDTLLNRLTVLFKGLDVLGVPRVATEQYKRGLGDTIAELQPFAERAFEKVAFSCLDDEACAAALADTGRDTVIVAGIEAHVCVSQTSLDLLQAGYRPVIVADAVSSRNPEDKETALRRLASAGVTVTSAEAILFELCRVSRTEEFKAISSLIK